MSDVAVSELELLLLDVMGTVVDDEGTVRREFAALGAADLDHAFARWDQELNAAMAEVNAGRREWSSHRQLRRDALAALIDDGALPELDGRAVETLVEVVSRYEPWPDSVNAISSLRRHVQVVALSNADLRDLGALSVRSGLAWHGVVSGQLVHRFKPSPVVYRSALELFQVDPARVMLVAAHPWDLRAAANHGMHTAFVARPGAELPHPDDSFSMQVSDLGALANAFDQAQ